jgi:ribose transport system substrate-binding protein
MRTWPIATAAVSALLVAGTAGEADRGSPVAGSAAAQRSPERVGLVLKALDNPFFVELYQGARAEAARLNVRLTVRSVPTSDDIAGQAAQVRAALAERDDCYVVNPATATNVIPALRVAKRPVVNVDSPIDLPAARRAGVRIGTFIGTDDVAGGRVAASEMKSLLPRGGDVALFNGYADSVNSNNRLRGFEAGIHGSRLRVAVRVVADYDRTEAQIATERILVTHPRISGFFAANDLMALGIADAVQAAGKAGRIKIIGYDGIPEALGGVQAGSVDATVSQYPYVMGRMAVEACVAAARGARLPALVRPPVALLAAGNIRRAILSFPRAVRPYADPFARLLR